jgi:hypothetical protein
MQTDWTMVICTEPPEITVPCRDLEQADGETPGRRAAIQARRRAPGRHSKRKRDMAVADPSVP